MKKKLFIMISTIVILCVGSVTFATTSLSDVKNTKYEDSVDTLITLGLVNGYEDNTYKPNNTVTRAEMAKLMVIALGEEGRLSDANNKQSKFKDMKGNWAYGYVNIAVDLGVINGYPDGTFGPQNTVSYAEATAMILRALEYDTEVKKSTEVWPNNYINYAKKLSLYSSIETINTNDGAKRGNVAIMLWNMLRTGMCTVVGQNSSGLVYGEGEKLLNKKMTKFIYLDDAIVQDVDFDEDYEKADVKIKGDKTITVSMDALEAAKMYGQKFNVLYNSTSKKIEKIEKTSDNTVKEGEIEKLTSSKIYIEGGNSKGYALPDDKNILLYGIDDISDAVTAILVLNGSSLEYVIAFPPEKTYLAIVTDNSVTVSKKDGIKVANYKTSTSKSYALADEDDVPDEKDVILYYLNSDSEIVIIDKTNLEESEMIENASKTKLTLEDKGKITLGSTDTYVVAKATSSMLKAMSISDIEAEEDTADVMEFAGIKYIIIYVDGVESAEETIEEDLKTYKSYLYSYIKKAQNVSEKTYTQASYTALVKALDSAENVYALKSPTLSKVKTAYNNLKSVYDSLVKAKTTDEKETVAAKYALRILVNGDAATCVKNKSQYTSSSYQEFNSALVTANKLLARTDATKTNLETAKLKLETAIKDLIETTTNEEKTKAIKALNTALSDAAKVGAKENYTETSYELFKAMWDEAKAINTTTATTEQIQNVTKNLNNAIAGLEGNSEKEYAELLILLKDAAKITNDDYFDAEYTKFETARDNADKLTKTNKASEIKTAKENLEKVIEDMNKNKISDALTVAKTFAEDYQNATEVSVALNLPELTRGEKITKIEEINDAITIEKGNVAKKKKELSAKIEVAKIEAEKVDEYTAEGIKTLKAAIAKAENVLNKTKVTSDELSTAVDELDIALEDFKDTKKPTTPSGDNTNQSEGNN